MADFYITQNDTLPSMPATLKDATGAVVDLTNAASVELQLLQLTGGTTAWKKTAVIVSATLGTVRYDWGAADTTVLGLYLARFEVTWKNGTISSFPNTDAPLQVLISTELVV